MRCLPNSIHIYFANPVNVFETGHFGNSDFKAPSPFIKSNKKLLTSYVDVLS